MIDTETITKRCPDCGHPYLRYKIDIKKYEWYCAYCDTTNRKMPGTINMRKRSPWDLLGCDPDFTGGLTTEEFMNEARGRGTGT